MLIQILGISVCGTSPSKARNGINTILSSKESSDSEHNIEVSD